MNRYCGPDAPMCEVGGGKGGSNGRGFMGRAGGERDAGVETHVFISSDANWEMLGADR
jgi:hypothetical protein